MRAIKLHTVKGIQRYKIILTVLWNLTMASAPLNWRLTLCVVPRGKGALHSTKTFQRKNVPFAFSPSSLSASWMCLGLLDMSLQVPGTCRWGWCGYPSESMSRIDCHHPAASQVFHLAQHHAGCLTAYQAVSQDQTACHFLTHSPGHMDVSSFPTHFQERQLTKSYKNRQVFYLEETPKGDLIWCLQFTSEEAEAQKGSGWPRVTHLAGLRAECLSTSVLHASEWVLLGDVDCLCFLLHEAHFQFVISLFIL